MGLKMPVVPINFNYVSQEPEWYTIVTKFNYEQKFVTDLILGLKNIGLDNSVLEIIVPFKEVSKEETDKDTIDDFFVFYKGKSVNKNSESYLKVLSDLFDLSKFTQEEIDIKIGLIKENEELIRLQRLIDFNQANYYSKSEEVVKKEETKKQVVKVMPLYVFVKVKMSERLFYYLKNTAGCANIMAASGSLLTMTDEKMCKVTNECNSYKNSTNILSEATKTLKEKPLKEKLKMFYHIEVKDIIDEVSFNGASF